MEARKIGQQFNLSDIFHVKQKQTNGTNNLYDPHPYLRERENCDNRTRTSFQDSNIFGYKQAQDVTWQGAGREERPAGIKTDSYHLASHTPGHTLYNPTASMAMHQTHTQQTFVEPERDMYSHNDPTVPKSRLGAEVYGVTDFNRQAVRQDLLSNDHNWLKHNEPAKNTEEAVALNPAERRIKEVYGNHENANFQNKDLKHSALDDWRNHNYNEKRSNVVQEVNPFEKRAQELSSLNNPLSATDYSHFVPKTKQQPSYEDVDKRVRDAMYSDLYGQSGRFGPTAPISKRSEIHSATNIFSKEGAVKGYRWGEDMSAAQRRQDFMKTTGFSHNYEAPVAPPAPVKNDDINQARAQLRMPKVIKGCELESTALHSDEFNKKYNVVKDHTETNIVSLRFNNLPKEMDAETLKSISGAKHVVRSAVQTDNIKNECSGQGEITIRVSDNESKGEIMAKYAAVGILAEDKPDDAVKRKSNYKELATTGWRDSRLEFEEKRHVNSGYENQRIAKIQNLNTTHGMGTNNNIVDMGTRFTDMVRSGQDNHLYHAQKSAINENHSLSAWDSMRPMTAQPVRSVTEGAYMRPTESFNVRSKQVQDSLRGRGYY